jgi:hypothetical protein
MRLGELLVAAKKITSEELDEALESQVLHGGRLGTNLIELGLINEQDLAAALGKLHNVPNAAGEMEPDPKALAMVDLDFADDKDLLPMRVDATRLSVAALNPHDFKTFDALAFKTGKRIVPVVVAEFRLHRLLRKHCKAFRPLRSLDVEGPKQRLKAGEADPKAPKKALDLMAEEEFQKLYAQALAGGDGADGAVVASAEIARAMTPAAGMPALVVPPKAPVSTPPQPATQSAPAAAAAPAPAKKPMRPPEPPLSFADAQAALAQSSDREHIARTVLRFASSKWKRSLLLSVQGDLVTGWHGLGALREEGVRRIGMSLRAESTFRLVRDLRSHFVGPMKHDAGTMVFYKLLGGGFPKTAVLLPLLVRGKVVHILYVDNGPDQLTPPDVGELLILSQSVARSYEALIQKRKKGAA